MYQMGKGVNTMLRPIKKETLCVRNYELNLELWLNTESDDLREYIRFLTENLDVDIKFNRSCDAVKRRVSIHRYKTKIFDVKLTIIPVGKHFRLDMEIVILSKILYDYKMLDTFSDEFDVSYIVRRIDRDIYQLINADVELEDGIIK